LCDRTNERDEVLRFHSISFTSLAT
jgi:hypothetical protein